MARAGASPFPIVHDGPAAELDVSEAACKERTGLQSAVRPFERQKAGSASTIMRIGLPDPTGGPMLQRDPR